MLDENPVHRRELLDGPLAVVATQAAVLLTAEGTVREIVDRRVIDVRHSRLHPQRKPVAALDVARHHRAREAVRGVLGYRERLFVTA